MKTKIFTKLKQKIVIIIISLIVVFEFITPSYSQAISADTVGGVLVSPVTALVALIGDVFNYIINVTFTGSSFTDQFSDNEVYITDNGAMDTFLSKSENQTSSQENSSNQAQTINKSDLLGNYGIPNIRITPIDIFSNKVALLDANYFESQQSTSNKIGGANNPESIVQTIKSTVSSWYNAFVMISVVGLLSVLVYIGIRIIISSTGSDAAKYKSMLLDWVIALCLVFCLNYIMSFTMTCVDQITSTIVGEQNTQQAATTHKDINVTIDGANERNQFATNLTGYIRFLIESNRLTIKVSAAILYVALTGCTLFFAYIYIKRVLTLTFLTIIAPLVALTYPIDKLKDSKAQAFEYWLKEYVVNAMLPVIHLVIYYVLIGSASSLVLKYPLYALIVLLFIVPAEKMVKEMFGIQSHTAPSAADLVGANVIGSMISKATSKSGSSNTSNGGNQQGKIRTEDDSPTTDSNIVQGSGVDALAGGYGNEGNSEHGSNPENTNNGQNPLQDMADTYDEGFGTADYDPAEAEAMRQAANSGDTGGQQYSDDEYEQILRDSGYNEDQIRDMMGDTAIPEPEQTPPQPVSPPPISPRRAGRKNGVKNMLKRRLQIPAGQGARYFGKGLAKAAKGYAKGSIRAATTLTGIGFGAIGGYKGIAAGAASGRALGTQISNNAGKRLSAVKDNLDEIKYGYEEMQNRKADKEFDMSYENRQHIKEQIEKGGGKASGAAIQSRIDEYNTYRRAGVTDIKEMDRIHGLQGLSHEKKVELAKLSKSYDKDTFSNKDKRSHATDGLKDKFANAGLEQNRANQAAKDTMTYLQKIKDA